MEKKEDVKGKSSAVRTIRNALILLTFVIVIVVVWHEFFRDDIDKKEKTTVITSSKLEKVLQISELSTYSITFNGVATVKDEKEKLLYHVAYKAKVNVGLDMSGIKVEIDDSDEENQKVLVILPEIRIMEADVDPGSLEYIFEKSSANTAHVSMTAIPVCKADAEEECNSNALLFELAKENAKNMVTALVQPLLEQYDEYSLESV